MIKHFLLIFISTPPNDFFATLYEVWGTAYLDLFSDCLYKTETYIEIGIWMVLMSFLLPLLYYQILKIQAWTRLYQWILLLFVNAGINVLISYNIITNMLYATACLGGVATAPTSMAPFLFIIAVWASIFFFLFSFIRKVKVGKASPAINVPF